MGQLHIQPTTIAHWHALVNEAEAHCSHELGEDLESYLVFLLMRFSEKPEMIKSVLALEFLQAINIDGSRRLEILKDVGDKCLLLSGLFPQQTTRRHLQESYYIDLGQNAYYTAASMVKRTLANLYTALSADFLYMRAVLQAIRQDTSVFAQQSLRIDENFIVQCCEIKNFKNRH